MKRSRFFTLTSDIQLPESSLSTLLSRCSGQKKKLFYGTHFHRFMSMLMFDAWLDADPVARELLEDGQNLIRFKKPEGAEAFAARTDPLAWR